MRCLLRWLASALLTLFLPVVVMSAEPAWACHHGSTHHETGAEAGVFWVDVQQSSGCDGAGHDTAEAGPTLQIDSYPSCSLGGSVVCQSTEPCGKGGEFHNSVLLYPDGHTEPGPQVCVGGKQPPSPPQVTGVRVLQAFRQIPLPTPSLGTSPPDRVTLVNLPTIFYTDAKPFSRTVRVLGRTVQLHIEPVTYEWSVGQGARFTTDWPGSPYQDGVTPQQDPDAYVTWSYAHAEKEVPAHVEVVWGATWSLDGKPMGRVPGTVTMASPATSLTVREARGVLTGE